MRHQGLKRVTREGSLPTHVFADGGSRTKTTRPSSRYYRNIVNGRLGRVSRFGTKTRTQLLTNLANHKVGNALASRATAFILCLHDVSSKDSGQR